MSSELQNATKPILKSLGCLVLAAVTSTTDLALTGGVVTMPLYAKAGFDLLKSLSSDFAYDQLSSIDPSALRKAFRNPGVDISNHDLYEALKDSLKLALNESAKQYKTAHNGTQSHFDAIDSKMKLLCDRIDKDFDTNFLEDLTDESIILMADGTDYSYADKFEDFLNTDELKSHGKEFLPFIKKQLPLNIIKAYAEILKTNTRVWVAYQRHALHDIQSAVSLNTVLTTKVLDKVNNLSEQLEKILQQNNKEVANGITDTAVFDTILAKFDEANKYRESSKENLEKYLQSIVSQLDSIAKGVAELNNKISAESKRAGEERKTILEGQQNIEDKIEKMLDAIIGKGLQHSPKSLTLRLPFLRPDQIVGRSEEVEELRKRLNDHRQVVLMNGMGGVGKSTVAQVYLTKYYDQYAHAAWIYISSDDFISDFINTPGLLDAFPIKKEGKKSQEIYNSLISSFNRMDNHPNLLIIDNAKEIHAEFLKFLPDSSKWHIVLTSRDTLDDFDLMELGFLNEEDAITLFEKHYKFKTIGKEDIRKIVHSVEYHTLTIEILAKTAQVRRLKCEDLLTALEEDITTKVSTRHSDGKLERITSYLCSIFKISELTPDEIWSLKQFYCLPRLPHSYSLLTNLLSSSQNEEIDIPLILSSLASKGWMLYDSDSDSYMLHRVIAEVISRTQEFDEQDFTHIISAVSTLLSIDQNKDNPIEKFPFAAYGSTLLDVFHDSISSDIALLRNNLALIFKDLGDYERAKELMEKALASDEKNFGEDHPSTAISYSNLALILQDLGDYERAKELMEKALASAEKNFGEDHPSTAISYSNLALILQDLGDYERAKELMEKALASAEKNFGEDHPSTAISYSNLAQILKDLGDYERAKELMEKALASAEKNFGEDHPSTAISYSNLAQILQDLGDYERAKELMEKALASAEKNFGEDHPSTAISYSNLAQILQDLGDYERAKELMEKALASAEKNFGEDHPSTAISYSNLAQILQDLGDYERAKELMEKALASDEKNFGEDHPSTARRYSNLALILKDLGDYERAKELMEKALASAEKNFGEDHPSTAISYSNLAQILKDLGDYERAKELSKKGYFIFLSKYGADHPYTKTAKSIMDSIPPFS